jgi:UDP:flavonoid glycosyltransferase YjiC (YdhE family)
MPEELSGETLRAGLARLLDEPSFKEGAAQIQKELLATPSPAEAVPALEQLVARRRR